MAPGGPWVMVSLDFIFVQSKAMFHFIMVNTLLKTTLDLGCLIVSVRFLKENRYSHAG